LAFRSIEKIERSSWCSAVLSRNWDFSSLTIDPPCASFLFILFVQLAIQSD
jgi:hypothetical protein